MGLHVNGCGLHEPCSEFVFILMLLRDDAGVPHSYHMWIPEHGTAEWGLRHFRIMFKNRNCQLFLCLARILSLCCTFWGGSFLMWFPLTTGENRSKFPIQYGCLSTCSHDVISFSQALSPYPVHCPSLWLQNRVSICCHGDGYFLVLQERKDCVNLFIPRPFNRSALLSCEGNLIWSDTW